MRNKNKADNMTAPKEHKNISILECSDKDIDEMLENEYY